MMSTPEVRSQNNLLGSSLVGLPNAGGFASTWVCLPHSSDFDPGLQVRIAHEESELLTAIAG